MTMRERVVRWRLRWAESLLTATPYQVVRREELGGARDQLQELALYVQRSGGLRAPHRIHAYRRIVRALDAIRGQFHEAIVTWGD